MFHYSNSFFLKKINIARKDPKELKEESRVLSTRWSVGAGSLAVHTQQEMAEPRCRRPVRLPPATGVLLKYNERSGLQWEIKLLALHPLWYCTQNQ